VDIVGGSSTEDVKHQIRRLLLISTSQGLYKLPVSVNENLLPNC